MRIAFILIGNSRRSNYLNGETIRYGNGGGSGTDGSTILVAEYLAKQGHEVVIATEKLETQLEENYKNNGHFPPKGEKIRGVYYTDIDFNFIENKIFDVLISSLWFHDYKKLPIKTTKSFIYWCHMQWIYGINEILEYVKENNLKLGFVHISNWEKKMNQGVINLAMERYAGTKTTLIPNPIFDDVLMEVLNEKPVKKPHKFIFHAAWARGGDLAVETIRRLNFNDAELHAFDYLMCTHDHFDLFFKRHNGVDKTTLFKHLAESEYFIYPLYTPYKDVHKDTFSCVVAEAIAFGCIPITYPLGALHENFNEYCEWIDFPNNVNYEVLQNEPLSKDDDGIFKNNIDNIVKTVLYLENNPEKKNWVKNNGLNFILNKFNTDKIGNMWIEFIKKIG